jgi:hypothetical protein
MSEIEYTTLLNDADKLIKDLELFETLFEASKQNKNGRWEDIPLSKINGTKGGTELEDTFQTGRAVQLIKAKLSILDGLIDPNIGLTQNAIWLKPKMDGTFDACFGAHRVHLHIIKGMKTIKAVVLEPREFNGRDQALSIFSCTENVPKADSYQVQATTIEDWLQKGQPLYEGFRSKAEESAGEDLPPEEYIEKVIEVALAQTKRVLMSAKFALGDPKGKKWAKVARTLKKADMRSMMKIEPLYDKDPTTRKTAIKKAAVCPAYKDLDKKGAFTRGNNGKNRTAKEHTVNVAGNGQDAKVVGRILKSNMARFNDGLPLLEHHIIGHATEEEDIVSPESLDEARDGWVKQQADINEYFKQVLKTAFQEFSQEKGLEHLVDDFDEFADDTQDFMAGTLWLAQHDAEDKNLLYPEDARLPEEEVATTEAEEESTAPVNGKSHVVAPHYMQ